MYVYNIIFNGLGVSGGWAGWAITHPVLGMLEGAARQRRRAALLLAHPDFGSYLRPCIISNAQKQGTTD